MPSPTRLVTYSQLALAVSLLLCAVLAPEVSLWEKQGGISNYGTMRETIVIFSLGFWACSLLLLRAAAKVKSARFKKALIILASSTIVLVLSTYPYKINTFFENLHIAIAFGLILFQQAIALYLAKWNRYDRVSSVFLSIQFVSIIFGLLTFFDVKNILFTAQVVGGIGFGGLLIHSVRLREARSR